MPYKTLPIALFALLVGMLSFVATAQADNQAEMDKLKERFKVRYPDLLTQQRAGVLGETDIGYVEAVDPKSLQGESKEAKMLAKLVKDENTDRKRLYEIIAEEQSTEEETITADDVAKFNGWKKIKGAEVGMYVKIKGRWAKVKPKKEGESAE